MQPLTCVYFISIGESCFYILGGGWQGKLSFNSFLLSISSFMCLFFTCLHLQFFSFLLSMIISWWVRDRQIYAKLRKSSLWDTIAYTKAVTQRRGGHSVFPLVTVSYRETRFGAEGR